MSFKSFVRIESFWVINLRFNSTMARWKASRKLNSPTSIGVFQNRQLNKHLVIFWPFFFFSSSTHSCVFITPKWLCKSKRTEGSGKHAILPVRGTKPTFTLPTRSKCVSVYIEIWFKMTTITKTFIMLRHLCGLLRFINIFSNRGLT